MTNLLLIFFMSVALPLCASSLKIDGTTVVFIDNPSLKQQLQDAMSHPHEQTALQQTTDFCQKIGHGNLQGILKNRRNNPLNHCIHPAVAEYLIRQGALADDADHLGRTPLFVAIMQCYEPMVRYYFSRGISASAKCNLWGAWISCFDLNLKKRIRKKPCSQEGKAQCAILKLLLENGAHPNWNKPTTQESLLELVAGYGPINNQTLYMARLLLKHGADVNLAGETTPIGWATDIGHSYLLELFCQPQYQANVYIQSKKYTKKTPLWHTLLLIERASSAYNKDFYCANAAVLLKHMPTWSQEDLTKLKDVPAPLFTTICWHAATKKLSLKEFEPQSLMACAATQAVKNRPVECQMLLDHSSALPTLVRAHLFGAYFESLLPQDHNWQWNIIKLTLKKIPIMLTTDCNIQALVDYFTLDQTNEDTHLLQRLHAIQSHTNKEDLVVPVSILSQGQLGVFCFLSQFSRTPDSLLNAVRKKLGDTSALSHTQFFH